MGPRLDRFVEQASAMGPKHQAMGDIDKLQEPHRRDKSRPMQVAFVQEPLSNG